MGDYSKHQQYKNTLNNHPTLPIGRKAKEKVWMKGKWKGMGQG